MYGIGLPANKQLYTDQTVYALMVNSGAVGDLQRGRHAPLRQPGDRRGLRLSTSDLLQVFAAGRRQLDLGRGRGLLRQRDLRHDPAVHASSAPMTRKATATPADLGVAADPACRRPVAHRTPSPTPTRVMLLSKDEAKQEAAKKFLAYLLEPDNYGRFLNMEPGLFLPVTEDGAKAETFWSDPVVSQVQVADRDDDRQCRRTASCSASPTATSSPRSAPISAQNVHRRDAAEDRDRRRERRRLR